jgi:poly(3-hydroxybutyrate) depolymerase
VIKIRKPFGGWSAQQGKWEKMMQAAARVTSAPPGRVSQPSHLTEVQNFGSNPGDLRMFTSPPNDLSEDCALMVVLHGCTQTAESYDRGAGWSTLADRFGFTLLLPEQQRCNNPNGCFNWFQAGDIERLCRSGRWSRGWCPITESTLPACSSPGSPPGVP